MVNLKKSDKIVILRGGISDEREISILTAKQVESVLKKKYLTDIIDVEYDCKKLIKDLIDSKPNKVFNCLHGFFGEDGQVQSILNYLKIPYTHSGVLTSSLAMNKAFSKVFFESLNVRCPKSIKFNKNLKSFPVIAKPICGGSSNGLEKIENQSQRIKLQKKEIKNTILEEYIEGRELTVGILNNEICGIMEIIFDSELYDFKNKYINIASHVINPKLPKEIREKIIKVSLKIHNTLNCNCISRLDFRYSSSLNEIFLLEINTQPGLTKNSLLPEMAKSKGINFLKLCEIILSNAKCDSI